MKSLALSSSPIASAPGLIQMAKRTVKDSFNIDGDVAARLWFVAHCWPDMPAGCALAIAEGEAKTTEDLTAGTVVVEWGE